MKRWIRALVAALAIATLAGAAEAATLSWTNPTMYTDNTLIPPEVLALGYVRVYYGDASGGPWTRIPSSEIPYPGTAYVFPAGYPNDGQWYTTTFVVQCDPALPYSDIEPTNKCASDYAVPSQYIAPPPPACTYTYTAWSTCASNGTQTRTVLSSSPAGCVGTPVLTQSCVYTPPRKKPHPPKNLR